MDEKEGQSEKKSDRVHLLRLPARASVWYTAAAFITKGISFAATPLFTRMLGASEYGVYVLYAGWMSVLSPLMTLDIGGAGLYGGFSRYENDARGFTKSALFALFSVFLAALIPFFIFIKRLSTLCGLPVFILYIMPLHTVAEACVSLFCTRGRFFYKYKSVFAANILPAVLAPTISFFFIKYMPPFAKIIGYALAAVITAVILLVPLATSASCKASADGIRYAVMAGAAMLPNVLASAALASADKLLIGKMHGDSALAKYSVAHSLGLVLTFATVGIYGALKPWIIRKLRCGKTGAVAATVKKLFSLFCILTVALTAAAPELFGFLAPKEYGDGLSAVYPFALSVLPMFLCNISSSALLGEGRGWIFSLCTVGVAAANAAMNTVLLKHFSFICSAFVFFISYLILSVCARCALKEKGLIGGKLYGMLALTAATVAAIYFLRGAVIIRLAVLIALSFPLATVAFGMFGAIREK